MTCYHPITAYKPMDGGPLIFNEVKGFREITIKCGQCYGCRVEKKEDWATRCWCEAQMHDSNMFVTLTYDDNNIPQGSDLVYEHWQLLARKIRRKGFKFRFFVSGEYSPENLRPHWHALMFGLRFPDLVKCNSVRSDHDLYNSEILTELWPYGFHTIGAVNRTTARYSAKYTMEKITGDLAQDHYMRFNPFTGEAHWVNPEFSRMSLKPGIGDGWIRRFHREVMTHGGIFDGHIKRRIPDYFRGILDELYGDTWGQKMFEMSKNVDPAESTEARLLVREKVHKAKDSFRREQ